jgi:hypothetical protein
MHNGRLIAAIPWLSKAAGQICYESARATIMRAFHPQRIDDISAVEPAGDTLHCLLQNLPRKTRQRRQGLDKVEVEKIVPSMEDVFIATVRRGVADAARG